MRLVWTPELATGYRQIDDQHKRLFQLFNDHVQDEDKSMAQFLVRTAKESHGP